MSTDDSHSCLKKDQVDKFHKHLNSINPHIQFTLELENSNGQGLPFLDTFTTRRDTEIQVDVCRKPTHTDRYLDFLSSHPLCHKRSVVNTLLRRAKTIPSANKGRREETQRVKAVLRENNYPLTFMNNCERALTRYQFQRICSASICAGRFRKNWSCFKTTAGWSVVHAMHINALHERKSFFKSNVSGHARKSRATFLFLFKSRVTTNSLSLLMKA